MKEGYKTTEFWLAMIPNIVGVALALNLITKEQSDSLVQIAQLAIPLIIAVFGNMVYTNGRVKLKNDK